jgi:hypothetical protein
MLPTRANNSKVGGTGIWPCYREVSTSLRYIGAFALGISRPDKVDYCFFFFFVIPIPILIFFFKFLIWHRPGRRGHLERDPIQK